jgi:hypothetical protein
MGMYIEGARPSAADQDCQPATAPAKATAGQQPTTAGSGAGPGVVNVDPAPRQASPAPLPVCKELPVPASDLVANANGSFAVAAGSHPVDTEQPLTDANHKPGVVLSESVNLSVTHKGAENHIVNLVTVAGGLRATEATLPGASAVGYSGSATVGHDFGPLLQLGVAGTLYGSNPLHVNDGDPKGEPAGYRFGQIAVTADSTEKLANGGSFAAHGEAAHRFGPGYTNRDNFAVRGTLTEPAGPVELAVTAGAVEAVWTDPTPQGLPRRLDVSGNLEVRASVPVGDSGLRVFGSAGFDGRVSSQDDGHGSRNYGNFSAAGGLEYRGSSSPKHKPKN